MRARKRLDLGCTVARHAEIGIHAVINARGGELWRNDLTNEDWEMRREARAIRDRIEHRVALHRFCSKFFFRHRARFAHLLSDPSDY